METGLPGRRYVNPLQAKTQVEARGKDESRRQVVPHDDVVNDRFAMSPDGPLTSDDVAC